MSDWDYTGYWNVVIGADRTPAKAVAEFELTADRIGLDSWLAEAEEIARNEGILDAEERQAAIDAWEQFHERALDELMEAAEDVNNG